MRRQPLGTEQLGAEASELGQLSDESIRQLVDGLNSLMEGEAAATMLLRCGARSIPALTEFLLYGRPASVPEPRRRAVKVLADLGARDSLIAYLEHERRIDDPILRFAEEAVESLAAELLARWPGDRTFDALSNLAARKKLIGICIAFGGMKRPEAVPFLIRDLADGVCCRAAEDALLQIGRVALPALCSAATSREIINDREAPSSVQRRRFALRVLRSMGIQSEDWAILRPLSHDSDAETATYACMVGLTVASQPEQTLLASLMLQAANRVNWFVQSEVQQTLLDNYPAVEWVVQQYANACGEGARDPAGRLARSIISTATGVRQRSGPVEMRWPGRIRGFFESKHRRRKTHD